MKHLSMTMFAAFMVVGSAAIGRAQDGAIDQATAAAFDARLFAAAPGNTFGNAPGKNTAGNKSYACFVRHYDADHLANHPKQKVGAMQLLVTGEIPRAKRRSPILSASA